MDKFSEILEKDLTDYKSIPFWSWNDKLDKEELLSQIDFMHSVGHGGFFIHARSGLKTEYLSEDWFDCISLCIEHAKQLGMNAWVYDENGWPSGFAGGALLKNKKNHVHYLEYKELTYFDKTALCVFIKINGQFSRVYTNSNESKSYFTIYDRQNESYVDILNPSIVDQFIALTHEQYAKRYKEYLGNTLKGFFTDEPQYFRWGTPWTPIMTNEFQKTYGYNVLDNLIFLFVEDSNSYKFRNDFWLLLNKLYINNYQKRIYEWCEKNNCKITGHTIDENTLYGQMLSCGDVMPFYEYEHIPGIDWLTRNVLDELPAKQCVSVACQLGKKQVLTETFGASGWDATPLDLKRIAEFQYVHGVNLMCQHLFPYSIEGTRKHDYPLFFSNHNPWITESKNFNDYFTHLGYLISNSTECVDTVIIHPLRSAYLFFNRNGNDIVDKLHNDFLCITEDFANAHIPHHFGDETIIEKYGKVVNDLFIIGNCAYKTVVIPTLYNLSISTINLLKEFIHNGGKVYLYSQKPEYQDGVKSDYSWLNSNITFGDLLKKRDYVVNENAKFLRSSVRIYKGVKFIYLVNTFGDAFDTTITIKDCTSIKKLDLLTMQYAKVEIDNNIVKLHFEPKDSIILIINQGSIIYNERMKKQISIDNIWELDNKINNYLTLDYASYSFDGNKYSALKPISLISNELLTQRKNREVFIKYYFEIETMVDELKLITENVTNQKVFINDCLLELATEKILDKNFNVYNILENIKLGKNEIVFKYFYQQDEFTYHVMLDDGITESLKNTITLKTEVDNCYLYGNFKTKAVGDFIEYSKIRSKKFNGQFYLNKPDTQVDGRDLVKNGFEFFAGELKLKKNIVLENKQYLIQLNGYYSLAKIVLNGVHVKTLMFDRSCNISNYIKEGNNEFEIILYNSNRNLLGPHHDCDIEPYTVCPANFGDEGWKNGVNLRWVDQYCFVNFGLELVLFELE